MGTFSRTILRKTARTNMEKGGFTQINKKKIDKETGKKYSKFSRNWRTYAPRKVEETEETTEE